MKTHILTGLIFLLIPLISLAQEEMEPQTAVKDSTRIAQSDSTEYELLVFDIGFENWLLTNSFPVWFYEKEYYRTKNHLFTINWNSRVRQAMYHPPYEYEIDYNPSVDYGVDVNWELFWYFKYLEHKFGINLDGKQ